MKKQKQKQKKATTTKKQYAAQEKGRKGKEFLVSSLQAPRQQYGAMLIEVNSN